MKFIENKKLQLALVYFVPTLLIFTIFSTFIYNYTINKINSLNTEVQGSSTYDVYKSYIEDATGKSFDDETLSQMSLADLDRELKKQGKQPFSSEADPFYHLKISEINDMMSKGVFLDQAIQEASNKLDYITYKDIKDIQNKFYYDYIKVILISAVLMVIMLAIISHYLGKKAVGPLEESIEKQKRFVSDSSHELKTPLALMKSEAELLLVSKNNTEEDYKKFAKNVVGDIDRMNGLIDSLLKLAKMDQKKQKIDKEKIHVKQTIQEIIDNFKILSDAKNIIVKNNIKENMILDFNQDSFSQIIGIAIDNAIKYTNQGGEIKIYSDSVRNKKIIIVEDSGIGISKENLKTLFDRFSRVSKDRNQKGYGLGLAIAKDLAKLNNADVRLDSIENVGTKFILTLDK